MLTAVLESCGIKCNTYWPDILGIQSLSLYKETNKDGVCYSLAFPVEFYSAILYYRLQSHFHFIVPLVSFISPLFQVQFYSPFS